MALGQVRSAAGRLRGYGVFWLKALRQPTIDLTHSHPYRIDHAHRRKPRPVAFRSRLDELVSQLRTVAAKTLPEESLTYGIFSGDRERCRAPSSR